MCIIFVQQFLQRTRLLCESFIHTIMFYDIMYLILRDEVLKDNVCQLAV